MIRRFADGDIDRDVYARRKSELQNDLEAAKAELSRYDEAVSNLAKYSNEVIATCSKLGGYWLEMDFDVCQKIQKLVFPDGAFWDHEIRGFLTQEMNPLMRDIFSLSMSYEDLEVQKRTTLMSCPI